MPADLTQFRIGRRRFIALAGSAAVLPILRGPARAWATDTYSRIQGATEVVILSDGHLTLPSRILATNAPQDEFDAAMTEAFGAPSDTFMPAANITLLKTGSDLVLVDNGSGNKFQPTAGKVFDNLAANGIEPGAITKVFLTHAHPDHAWGTTLDDGALAFPNAEIVLGETEWQYWTDPDLPGKMPEEIRPFALGTQRELAAVKDRVTLVKDGDTVIPGVSAIATSGHTPGHMSLMVEGGKGLIVGGDVMPNPVISVKHPDWIFGFDTDPELGIATRRRMLDRTAVEGHEWIGFHFPYPGIGVIERAAEGYHFTAA